MKQKEIYDKFLAFEHQLSDRILKIEHTMSGNGAFGILDQIKELRREIQQIKKMLKIAAILGLLLYSETLIQYIHLLIK